MLPEREETLLEIVSPKAKRKVEMIAAAIGYEIMAIALNDSFYTEPFFASNVIGAKNKKVTNGQTRIPFRTQDSISKGGGELRTLSRKG